MSRSTALLFAYAAFAFQGGEWAQAQEARVLDVQGGQIRAVTVAAGRITSYNVCYTKLLRSATLSTLFLLPL